MHRILIAVFFLTGVLRGVSQDSLLLDMKFAFEEGVFPTIHHFHANMPIPKEDIVFNLLHDDPKFWEGVMRNDSLYYKYDSTMRSLAVHQLWGACIDGALYIQTETGFYKMINLGRLCYFPANKITTGVDPGWGMYEMYPYFYQTPRTTSSLDLDHFIMEFYTGTITELTVEVMEMYLEQEPELAEKFSQLKRKEQRKVLPLYIRLFNNANPVKLPVN